MDKQDNKKWYKAMLSEMESLEKNDTWDLVQLQKTLPCKWVYKMKVISDSSPKYKARLVAKGYKQEYGVDFDEIFSLLVKTTTLRIILGLVAAEDMELIQMDVKTAFLHGDLDEDIYMEQPEGYEVSSSWLRRARLFAASLVCGSSRLRRVRLLAAYSPPQACVEGLDSLALGRPLPSSRGHSDRPCTRCRRNE